MKIFGFEGRIHPIGWLFIGSAAGITVILGFFSSLVMGVGCVVTLWCLYFFRDPARVPPCRENLILSPADGIVKAVSKALPPAELNLPAEDWTRISIFLNIFDVHVQRIPIAGMIEQNVYHPGKFINASFDKASDVNERRTLLLAAPQGVRVICVQIAGLIARRIVCHVTKGQTVVQGQRYGIICFGSRVDLYVPASFLVLVSPGQRMVGGETVLAEIAP